MLTSDDARRIIPANLAAIIECRGWTQTDLAKAVMRDGDTLGAARMRVNRWLAGKVLPDPADLVNLSDILSVTIEEIVKPSAAKPR